MSRISLSILDLVPRLEGVTFEEALEQAVNLAILAEKWGYKRYWSAEHHDMEHLSSASPEVLLSHIGARTSTIRLGSGAVLLPHYSPLKVTENFRMLASLYPGRVDLGAGRAPGGSAHASMALSGNFLANVAEMPNRIQALVALLNDTYTYEDVSVTAKPVPRISPELWLLGTNVKSAAMAAEFGTGYVFGQFMSDKSGVEVLAAYREAFQPSPLIEVPRSIIAIGVICAETEEEAARLAEKVEELGPERPKYLERSESLDRTYSSESSRSSENHNRSERPDSSDVSEHFEKSVHPENKKVPSETETPSRLLIGTPEQVRSKLVSLSEQAKCEEFLIFTPIDNYVDRLKSYQLLAASMLNEINE